MTRLCAAKQSAVKLTVHLRRVCRTVAASPYSRERFAALAEACLAALVMRLQQPFFLALSRRLRTPLAALPCVARLARAHAPSLVHAAVHMLFREHGYRRPRDAGDAAAYLLPCVLVDGIGGPVSLAVVLREVCRAAGVELALSALEGGTHCVVWPVVPGNDDSDGGVASVPRNALQIGGHQCALVPCQTFAMAPFARNTAQITTQYLCSWEWCTRRPVHNCLCPVGCRILHAPRMQSSKTTSRHTRKAH